MRRFVVHVLAVLLCASAAEAASTLTISWQDNSNNEDGFNVERSSSASGPFSRLGAVGPNVTSFLDASLPEATNFCYRTNAFNTAGASPYTAAVCGVTKATLTLVKNGSGLGQVVSQPAGINCTGTCAVQFNGNSNVTLTAAAGAGSVFTGWGGACTGTGPCNVTMNSAKSVTATFYADSVAFVAPGGGNGNAFLAGGVESGGLERGAAFQVFDASGNLQTSKFALNNDFTDVSFLMGNFDADQADEVLVGGRETTGPARGPAYQLFEADGTAKFTRFVLNSNFSDPSFSPLSVNSTNGVLVCGRESAGSSRGPAYQAFDASGNLVRTQFALTSGFTTDNSCAAANLDGVAGDEVIVAGNEVSGLARGPAFQVFNSNGSLRFTRFALNPDFAETQFSVMDVGGSKNILVYGQETSGSQRGPGYQLYDVNGNLALSRFVLTPNFVGFQALGINTTGAVAGDEILTGGIETSGLSRGPIFQVWDKSGNLLFSRLALNPGFTEAVFGKIDINNDGVDEIVVLGRETGGLARGPVFQVFNGSGTLLFSRFALNANFTNLGFFTIVQNGAKRIGIAGVETAGPRRGPAYQIFDANGALLHTMFALNSDF